MPRGAEARETDVDGAPRAQPSGGDSAPTPPKPRGLRRLVPFAGAALVVLALTTGWFLTRPATVIVAPLQRGAALDIVYGTGVVEYVRQANLAPPVSAPIRNVLVNEGDIVRRGQALAQLVDDAERGALAQIEVQAAQARADAQRTEMLFRRGYVSTAAHEQARSVLRADLASVSAARARLADYVIQAPFAGTIIRRDAEPGDLATPAHALFVLADRNQARVTATVDERDVARLKVGQESLLRADGFPGRTFSARVVDLTPAGDSTARLFRVRLGLPNNSELRPGMTVEVNVIAARRDNALLAPASSFAGGGLWVVRDGQARRLTVEKGAVGADRLEIRAGAKDGDVAIVKPAGLKDGQHVRAAPAAGSSH